MPPPLGAWRGDTSGTLQGPAITGTKEADRVPQPLFRLSHSPLSDGPHPAAALAPFRDAACWRTRCFRTSRREGAQDLCWLQKATERTSFSSDEGRIIQPTVQLDVVGSDLKADRKEVTSPRTLSIAHYIKYKGPASKCSSPTCFSKISLLKWKENREIYSPLSIVLANCNDESNNNSGFC